MIQFRCECGKLLQARDDQAGMSAACPVCAAVSTVPGGDAPQVFGLTAVPLPPGPLPEPMPPRLPALRPEIVTPSPQRRQLRAILGALFLIAVIIGGVYVGWWRNRDEARARRTLEDELPKQNQIRPQSIELRRVPAEEGGEKGDFTGTVTDEQGRVWEIVRVRIRRDRVEWFLREPEEKLRGWVAEYVEKNLDAKVKSFDITRTPDGRRVGKVTTTTGLVLDLEEEPMTTVLGKLTPGSTKVQLTPESVIRRWEQRIVKQYPQLKLQNVTLKQDSEGSWSGTAVDHKGQRFVVSVKAEPEEPGKDRQYSIQVLPLGGE